MYINLCFFFIEIWILYCGKKIVVLKVVEEVYYYYEKIELLNQLVEFFDLRRYIKFIDLFEVFFILCNFEIIKYM